MPPPGRTHWHHAVYTFSFLFYFFLCLIISIFTKKKKHRQKRRNTGIKVLTLLVVRTGAPQKWRQRQERSGVVVHVCAQKLEKAPSQTVRRRPPLNRKRSPWCQLHPLLHLDPLARARDAKQKRARDFGANGVTASAGVARRNGRNFGRSASRHQRQRTPGALCVAAAAAATAAAAGDRRFFTRPPLTPRRSVSRSLRGHRNAVVADRGPRRW